MTSLIEKLNWRYATKKMDPSKAVPRAKLDRILESIRLTATSSGLQPFEVIVVSDPSVRARIREHARGQPQVTDSSCLLVFAAWDNYTADRINRVFDLAAAERGRKIEGSENRRQILLSTFPMRSAEENYQHAARQAYIALGTALIAAAEEQVDTTPMEGFEPAKIDEILGLRERGLRSVLLLPLGYRAAEGDWLQPLKKVRRPREQFISEV